MSYGPTIDPSTSTACVLAYGKDGNPCLWWECGITPGTITTIPGITFELELEDGSWARAIARPTRGERLVDDPGRERVSLCFGRVERKRLWLLSTLVCGVHVVFEERADGFVGATVVPNFGTLDPSKPKTWPGAVRFKRMRVVPPPGWTTHGGTFGPAGDWYGSPREWTSRVFAFVPDGASATADVAAQRWLQLADLNANGAPCLGPSRWAIPMTASAKWFHLHGTFGSGPFLIDRDGPGGGVQGGAGVQPIGGAEASTGAAREYHGDVPRVLAGHPVAMFDLDGQLVWPNRWPNPKGYPLTDGAFRFDPWNAGSVANSPVGTFGWAVGANGPKEFNPGPSTSRGTMLKIQNHDGAHYGRATSQFQGAWYGARSYGALLGLRASAANFVASRLMTGPAAAEQGDGFLREQGWCMQALAAAIAVTPPGADRDKMLGHREQVLAFTSKTCQTNGWGRRGTFEGNSDALVPWLQDGLSKDYAACAVFQLAIYATGLKELWDCGPELHGVVDQVRYQWLLCEGARSLYDNPRLPIVLGSPPDYVGVALKVAPNVYQTEVPLDTGAGRSHDSKAIHDWHHIVLCWLETGDPRWLQLLGKLGYPDRSITQLQQFWKSSANQQPAWTALAQAYVH